DVLVFNPTMGHWRIHEGIDVTGEAGAPVYAAADGVIESVYDDPLLGKCVRISHSGQAVTVYCNLQNELAEGIVSGATVESGQALGAVGETALSEVAEEPHLHFEMEVNGVSVDPLDYISKESQEVSFTFDDTAYEG
ncbi:MAG: M23 family metallopeptidase, partial [Clostridia bacterium]|nr:M23 family metallopeptidase [Clostridia bacterium]